MSDEKLKNVFEEFFKNLDWALSEKLHSVRRLGFPINNMSSLINSTREETTIALEKLNYKKIFNKNTNPSYTRLIIEELNFFVEYLDNFKIKRDKIKKSKSNNNEKTEKNISWKSLLTSLKVFVESLKDFLSENSEFKGILSIYKELLEILG